MEDRVTCGPKERGDSLQGVRHVAVEPPGGAVAHTLNPDVHRRPIVRRMEVARLASCAMQERSGSSTVPRSLTATSALATPLQVSKEARQFWGRWDVA